MVRWYVPYGFMLTAVPQRTRLRRYQNAPGDTASRQRATVEGPERLHPRPRGPAHAQHTAATRTRPVYLVPMARPAAAAKSGSAIRLSVSIEPTRKTSASAATV